MPIEVNDIIFVDISELEKIETLSGSEEIQINEHQKVNLKDLLSKYITSTIFTQTLTNYPLKNNTYTKIEVTNLVNALASHMETVLLGYLKGTDLSPILLGYIDKNTYDNFVTSIGEALEGKVSTQLGFRLLGENELDNYSAIDTSSLSTDIDFLNLNNYSLKVTDEENIKELKIPLNEIMGNLATYQVVDSTSKEITHSYGDDYYPSIIMVDLEGNEVAVSVRYMSGGRILVSWNESKSGKIILKR